MSMAGRLAGIGGRPPIGGHSGHTGGPKNISTISRLREYVQTSGSYIFCNLKQLFGHKKDYFVTVLVLEIPSSVTSLQSTN